MTESANPSLGSSVLGSDIGGTFTDLVLFDAETGTVRVEKVPSTQDDPARGVLAGLAALDQTAGDALTRAGQFIHATTLVANTIVERRGPRTALLVTDGFRDLLRLRRHWRVGTFRLYADPPEPLVPRALTFAVRERMLADGKPLLSPDEDHIRELAHRLLEQDVRSVAVVLLHSYANASHEEFVAEVLEREAPSISVTLSSRVLRQAMEYERASTTVVDAYCSPVLGHYLGELETEAQRRGVNGKLFIMTSSGGISSVAAASPVRLVESGPAAGATFAAELARQMALGEILAFDMGGTTAKGCLIRDGVLPLAEEIEVARSETYLVGSGLPLRVPTVELIEIGAGGGSIARRDAVGLLRVGPQSAGASPGPACYMKGGHEPTVTDSDLVLGHLDAKRFLGGEMPLGVEEARRAVLSVADPDVTDAVPMARTIQDVIHENMAAAIMQHVIERGGDPSRLVLVPFGGAGPVHAYTLARRLGMHRVVVPPLPGVTSAFGLLVAAPSYQVVRTIGVPLDEMGASSLVTAVVAMREEVATALATVDPGAEPEFAVTANCAYHGQSSSIPIPIDEHGRAEPAAIARDFADAYRQHYGYYYDDVEVDVASVRVAGALHGLQGALGRIGNAEGKPPTRSADARPAFSHATGSLETFAVVWRANLAAGTHLEGPVIIEERESTTVVDVGGSVDVDDFGNLQVAVR